MASSDVLAGLPHRAPFLFVDRIVEQSATRILTEWDVSAELPAFAGHFPDQPVLPGVLMAEFCFQSAALLFSGTPGAGLPVLTRIEDARYKKVVRPGETLRAEVTLVESLSNARWCKAHVTSAGASVLRIGFVVAQVQP
ncbi:MAG: beta-hydroxyacyl-ACP dehydratase [Planctomycetes bacterium]|nr:beta-hydroxyacyl-ACP dehydratase [Planctomycetota bacterium]